MLNFIKEKSIFYIVAPANLATGGPELLHQLASKLKLRGKEIYMYYQPSDHINPIHNNYKEYNIPFVREIKDSEENILIVPEINIDILKNYNKIKKIIWWLSVDYYFLSMPHIKGKINRFLHYILNYQKYIFFDKKQVSSADFHLCQSEYSKNFLERNGIKNTEYLSDYLHVTFFRNEVTLDKKENIVVYNPKKITNYGKKLIRHNADISFIPIQNMSRDEVIDLLKRAKVYIDFGNHPGKDRIPREAIYLKCCVITNKKGSAYFKEDLPICNEYKFDEHKVNFIKISRKIHDCLNNFNKNIINFEKYRDIIKEQENEFERQITNIIG